MKERTTKQQKSDDQLAREMTRALREARDSSDSVVNSIENGNEHLDRSKGARDLAEELASAKKVMQLLAKVRPIKTPGFVETVGLDPDEVTPQFEDEQSATLEEPNVTAEIPSTIDRFEVIRLIGQGGFGLVFLARDPVLERMVALKVPTFESLLNDNARDRFHRESRMVATLGHPNVVPIFEVGNEGPISYIASEYIPGTDLAKWVTNHGPLDPKLAARTVSVIADAIQHAHTRDVIHRDLKPANVLLEIQDTSEPDSFDPDTVRVVDFGLATFLDKGNESVTRTGSIVGTPAYSAPEQLQTNGQDHSSKSADVYSLGAVLYFLLTGKAPFTGTNIVEVIRDAHSKPAISPGRLNPKVPQDLAAICLKCLAKSPTNRYESAYETMQDLLRFIDDKPVIARPVPRYQSLWRWVNRNPALAMSTLISAIAIIGGLVASLWYGNNARVAAAHWKDAETEARVEAKTAQETYQFMVNLFRSANPMDDRGNGKERRRNLTAESILKRGAEDIKNSLLDEPRVRSELMTAIGLVCLDLGMYEDAESLLNEALQIKSSDPNTENAEIGIANFNLGRCFRFLDREADAIQHLRIAEQLLEPSEENQQKTYARCLSQLGMLMMDADYAKAKNYMTKARNLMVEAAGEEERLWELDANLASLEYKNGILELARDAFVNALSTAESFLGPDHARLEPVIGNLAFVEKKLGNYSVARTLQERGLELVKQHLGPEHPSIVGALINIVQVCQKMDDLDAALIYGEELLKVANKSLPTNHRYVAIANKAQAKTHFRLGDFEIARELTRLNLMQLTENDTQAGINNRFRTLVMLASIERADKQFEKASEYVDSILDHPQIDKFDGAKIEAMFESLFLSAEESVDNDLGSAVIVQLEQQYRLTMQFAATTNIQASRLAFNESRYFAILEAERHALDKLEEAFELGFSDRWMLKSDDFDSVRSTVRFQTQIED